MVFDHQNSLVYPETPPVKLNSFKWSWGTERIPSPNSESAYLECFPTDSTLPFANAEIKLWVKRSLPIGLVIFPFSTKNEPFLFKPVTTCVIGSNTLQYQNSLI